MGKAVSDDEDAPLLAEMNADFERLMQDSEARARYDAELHEWDRVLLDGLDAEPTPAS